MRRHNAIEYDTSFYNCPKETRDFLFSEIRLIKQIISHLSHYMI